MDASAATTFVQKEQVFHILEFAEPVHSVPLDGSIELRSESK